MQPELPLCLGGCGPVVCGRKIVRIRPTKMRPLVSCMDRKAAFVQELRWLRNSFMIAYPGLNVDRQVAPWRQESDSAVGRTLRDR